jgi:Zn-dependent protease with chaperone function
MKTIQDFHALVEYCEKLALESPATYRWKVGGLAALGIGFVMALAVGSLGLGLGLAVLILWAKAGVLLKLAILPMAFAYYLGRALWVTFPEPTGKTVTSQTSPKLFAEIEAVRKQLGAQRVHRILIEPEKFNAAIVQIPRLGPLGWTKNYLILGLPLLESMTRDEFRAVLAHEFGHLSRHDEEWSKRLSCWAIFFVVCPLFRRLQFRLGPCQ